MEYIVEVNEERGCWHQLRLVVMIVLLELRVVVKLNLLGVRVELRRLYLRSKGRCFRRI